MIAIDWMSIKHPDDVTWPDDPACPPTPLRYERGFFRPDSGCRGRFWPETTHLGPAGMVPPNDCYSPVPVKGATVVAAAPTLSWLLGPSTQNADVYFGTSSTLTTSDYKGNQSTTTYATGTLAYSTTYYWRLDAQNANGLITGPVWSFTTQRDPALGATTSHVQTIALSYKLTSSKYYAVATITVKNNLGVAVSGVTVSGMFNGQYNSYQSAITDATGTAVITSTGTRTSAPTAGGFGFNISTLSGGSLTYTPAENATSSAQY